MLFAPMKRILKGAAGPSPTQVNVRPQVKMVLTREHWLTAFHNQAVRYNYQNNGYKL